MKRTKAKDDRPANEGAETLEAEWRPSEVGWPPLGKALVTLGKVLAALLIAVGATAVPGGFLVPVLGWLAVQRKRRDSRRQG